MPAAPPTIGQLAETACVWEVRARKAGNVCPGREFADLTVDDFLASATAIAPVFDAAPHQAVGVTVLHAIEATRRVVATNTNLGIVLLLAPLAAGRDIATTLRGLTVDDSRHVFAAINLANPSGLGAAHQEDVHDEPTLPLRKVMALAQERDLIARQYVTDFAIVHETTRMLCAQAKECGNLERAVVETQLWFLSRFPDSHIERKRGYDEAAQVRDVAAEILSAGGLQTSGGRRAYLAFDAWLRADNHARNPGTTADFLAASLFCALRDHGLSSSMPFTWDDHPFAVSLGA